MMDKIALILVIRRCPELGRYRHFRFRYGRFPLWRPDRSPFPNHLRTGGPCRTVVHHAAVPGHGARHRPSSHGLSTLEKRAPVGALFYFPSFIA